MITREEVIEVCNNLGLVEYSSPGLEDYRPWKFSSSIFKTQIFATIVVLAKNPDDEISGHRLYFYDKLKYFKDDGFIMKCENNFLAYCTKDGKDYAEIYSKKTFETAIKNIIKKVKATEMNLKLKNIQKDFK